MNQKIIIAVVILGLVIGLLIFLRQPKKVTPPENKENITLPENWKVASSSGKLFKIEKTGNYQIKPLVVTSVSYLPETEKADTYVDRLITGAKATLSGLKYTVNQKETIDGFYLRRLAGSYYSGKNKINVFQRIYIKNNDITTFTASCLDKACSSEETNPIFDTLFLRLSN